MLHRSRSAIAGRLAGPCLLIASIATAIACAPPGGNGRAATTLVAALTSDPGHLNPAITTAGGVHTAASLLYDGLVELDDDLVPRPALAERWTVEDDGALYRFHLRRGVTWHDGTPFTAADVRFTFEQILLNYHARTRASVATALASIATPDSFTVEFRFHQPYAPFLQQLDADEAPMVPRHLFAGTDPQTNPANHAPVGTGPFRFEGYVPGAEIRYAANPRYFAGAPSIERLILRVIPDPGLQVVALEAGEVDWLFGVPGPDRARLQADPAIRVIETSLYPGGSNCVMTIGFNLDRPVFRDVRTRRAVAHALDRPQFLERVLFGAGRAATAPISSGIAFAHPEGDILPAFDTLAAARLLDDAGWRTGRDGIRVSRGVAGIADGTRLAFGFSHFPTFSEYAELLRAQLRRVGIDLTLQPLEPAVFVDAVFRARKFDTGIVSYCQGTDPEIGFRRLYHSTSIGPVPFSNAAGYSNRAVDSLFDAARQTVDVAERRRLYLALQAIITRDLPYVWLVETKATRAFRTRCQGFRNTAHFAAAARCGP